MELKGKRIIVTGGANGIAAGTVRGFVKAGATVAVLDIMDEAGQQVVDFANTLGDGHATYYHCNVADKEEVDRVFEQAASQMGGLDVLAHIAAIDRHGAAEDFTPEDMQFFWGVNINGTIFTNQAACHIMRQQQGEFAIINFASDVALAGMPNSALYATSKGAVLSWSRTIAYEWAVKYNIRTNCVNPTMKTPMYDQYVADLEPAAREVFLKSERLKVPMKGEMGDVDRDMAPVMVFLASDASSYINGQIIPVNGGRNMLRG
ncbi:MAG: SDR family oxidoreductase [Caryophanon sp.]|nr:SDR family oxidoreductase [Caryophanon sp.]